MAKKIPRAYAREGAHLEGVAETKRNLTTAIIAGPAAGDLLDKWRFATLRVAIAAAPVYQRHYRRSLTSERDDGPFPKEARVGSNLDPVARVIEGGTGTQADLPGGTGRPHWPPAAALEAWAAKKQIPRRDRPGVLTGRDVAAIIGRRGGLKPKRVLRNAVEATEPRIATWVDEAGAQMVEGFGTNG